MRPAGAASHLDLFEQPAGFPSGLSTPSWGKLAGVKFEVEIYQNEAGEWVATAVEHGVSAKGVVEKEALARLIDALAVHFKQQPPSGR